MPPSQLKRLKASLREQGITGPQKSKKERKKHAQNGANSDKRVNRNAALSAVREQFAPFEFKLSARGPKFDVTTDKTLSGRVSKGIASRPGVKRAAAEENRRKTLGVELNKRNKVGGILDRRFGEDDPSMAPEDRMLERFTREQLRQHKNSSLFDLEDEDEGDHLTHMGQSLSLDGPTLADDFEEDDLQLSGSEDHPSDEEGNSLKRRRASAADGEEEEEEDPQRPEKKKTKQEVMKELIAKSKFHKYERQQAKEDDEDLREELDKAMPDLQALLRGAPAPKPKAADVAEMAGMNPDRAALLSGADRAKMEKEYDIRLRQLALDKKAQPTVRTKTEEEKLQEESKRLQELEASRLRRMQGEPASDDDQVNDATEGDHEDRDEEDDGFGLGTGIKTRSSRPHLDVEDEDDFVLDDDLIASGSEIEFSDGEEEESEGSADESDEEVVQEKDDADDFVAGLNLTEEEAKRPEYQPGAVDTNTGATDGNLAYTYPCPTSHEELLEITKGVAVKDLPTVVRRIRALYHPKLRAENKAKSAAFLVTLIDHVPYLANQRKPDFAVIENLTRHIHSMAKMYPIEAANAFRKQLDDMNASRALALNTGDLAVLKAIGTVFPTSDHFHQVVTPSLLVLGKYLGQKISQTDQDLAVGTFLGTLCVEYQRLAKRYVPEVMNFIGNTLCVLAPAIPAKIPGNFPYHEPKQSLRVEAASDVPVRQLTVSDLFAQPTSKKDISSLKIALLSTNIKLLDAAADIWTDKPSLFEVFQPALKALQHLSSSKCRSHFSESTLTLITKTSQKFQRLLAHATRARRPLELHHHRPLAIKTSIPKFEETFDPTKHYDPDRERAEMAKLKAEHKRERKGAIRELRKDANFIARDALQKKKDRDAAYEKWEKRSKAMIQGEEGAESKSYEREKEWRKKGRK